jgi:hypothetical protein
MEINLADELLCNMVEAFNRVPDGRFVLARAISGRGKYRISHPGGSMGLDAAVLDQLLERRMIAVTVQEPGFKILVITLRGFDYVAHLARPQSGAE